jgi:hypothetical protein
MAIEDALISSARGDFVSTLTAVLAIFIMTTFGYFIHWVTKTIPEQMEKDRDAIVTQMVNDRIAICDKLSAMIEELRGTKDTTLDMLERHDDQAKKILETDTRIETTLVARPCIAQR